jgi:hypothetical protein
MAESPASGPLHALQAELSGAKSQWEYLHGRLTNGYKDAYKWHAGALKQVELNRKKALEQDARMRQLGLFIFSVTTVGFAGGVVGGLLAPWVKNAAEEGANAVFREAVKEITKQSAQQAVMRAVPQKPEATVVHPFEPVSDQAFDTYMENKEELDGCFARVNSWLQAYIDLCNKTNAPAEDGLQVLNSFRRNCPLLRDKPDPDKLPARDTVAKGCEIAMWVAWASLRDWNWWNKVYDAIDKHGPSQGTVLVGVKWAKELDPILERMSVLKKDSQVSKMVGQGTMEPYEVEEYDEESGDIRIRKRFRHKESVTGADQVIDLRKLRDLKLDSVPELPLAGIKAFSPTLAYAVPRLQGEFLQGLRNLLPLHKRGK